MGSAIPFEDSVTTFSAHARALDDEELLNVWEQSQKIVSALQQGFMPEFHMKSNVEESILIELLRRDTEQRHEQRQEQTELPRTPRSYTERQHRAVKP